MFSSSHNSVLKGITIGLLLLLMVMPAWAQRAEANQCWAYGGCSSLGGGWAVGAWYYYYSSGCCENDFSVYTHQTGGFCCENYVDYVFTDSVNGYAPQIAIQVIPQDYNVFCLIDQIWYLGEFSPLFNSCRTNNLSSNNWNFIETTITYSSQYSAYFVNWLLNGKWFNSWDVGQQYFDAEMNPSYVIETTDMNQGDFGANFGYLQSYFILNANSHLGGTYLSPNYFYGGLWCTVLGGCFNQDIEQTSNYLVGANTESPHSGSTPAVAGHSYDNSNGMFQYFEFGIGYPGSFPNAGQLRGAPITQGYAQYEYANHGLDMSSTQIS